MAISRRRLPIHGLTRLARALLVRPEAPLLGFVAACLTLFAINLLIDHDPEFVWADGNGYYAWARSVMFDGDVRFANEFAVEPWPAPNDERGVDGGPLNWYPVGMALVEAIPIAIGSVFVEPLWPTRGRVAGYGGAHLLTMALFLLSVGMVTVFLFLQQLARDLGNRGATIAAWSLLGATALIEFASRTIGFTHLMDVAIVSLLWLLAHRSGDGMRHHIAVGFLAGLAVVVRMTNVLLLPWLAAWHVYRRHRLSPLKAIAAAFAASIPLSAQLLANRAHRGAWLPEPYPSETFSWLSPRVFDTLFSLDAGWLMWHPIYLVLIAGLLLSWKTFGASPGGRAVWWAAILAVLAQIWVIAAWSSWGGGAIQFGHRLFIALTPMLLVMGAYGTRLSHLRATPAILAALVAWNMYLFVGVSVAKLEGTWDPGLRDVVRWERRILPAVVERLQRDR